MNTKPSPIARLKRWFTGSISRKLSLFVFLVCLFLIALVWILGVQLLQPTYNATIKAELSTTLDTFTAVLNQAEKDQVPLVSLYLTDTGPVFELSSECRDRLNAEISAGHMSIENLCIDMSTAEHGNVLLQDYLPSNCVLHEKDVQLTADGEEGVISVIALRREILGGQKIYRETENQMIMGQLAANGQVAVILSANLERIPQAVGVLQKLMLGVSVVLLVVSVLAAVLFSRWFTKPILRLSAATQEMAKGNYDARVEETGNDEIADLSHDFNEMAVEVKRSVDLQRDLVANVSHDLRTPLTLIKGYAETVRDITGDDVQKRTDQLNVIVDEADRLSGLVGSVLELSRVSSGHEKPHPVRFDLSQLCEELAYRYQMACGQQNCHVEFTGAEGCFVLADATLIERALHNLLGNALHHKGDDGYIGLTVTKTSEKTIRVTVSDHGPGIAQEDMPHLFDKFYRSRQNNGQPGTGLGLSITKAIFEAHGFTYGVYSEPGQGASFWFEAPVAP